MPVDDDDEEEGGWRAVCVSGWLVDDDNENKGERKWLCVCACVERAAWLVNGWLAWTPRFGPLYPTLCDCQSATYYSDYNQRINVPTAGSNTTSKAQL